MSNHAVIGKNCNLGHGVTVEAVYRGERMGTPVIGNNVYIGPGAKVIGGIRVDNNAAIWANCVFTRDFPENAVVVEIPGRVISFNGSAGCVNNNTDLLNGRKALGWGVGRWSTRRSMGARTSCTGCGIRIVPHIGFFDGQRCSGRRMKITFRVPVGSPTR